VRGGHYGVGVKAIDGCSAIDVGRLITAYHTELQ